MLFCQAGLATPAVLGPLASQELLEGQVPAMPPSYPVSGAHHILILRNLNILLCMR